MQQATQKPSVRPAVHAASCVPRVKLVGHAAACGWEVQRLAQPQPAVAAVQAWLLAVNAKSGG